MPAARCNCCGRLDADVRELVRGDVDPGWGTQGDLAGADLLVEVIAV
jgi:hypothetical protein